MTKEETIKVLQSIEDRAVDFPYMTACDWVAIAAAKRHLSDDKIEEVDLEKELSNYIEHYRNRETGYTLFGIAKHFFELGIRSKATKASEFLKKHFEETPQEELDINVVKLKNK